MSAVEPHAPIVGSPLPDRLQLHWQGEDDTRAFARRLALQPALQNAFVALRGDLGAGKTTLVRHLLGALGVQGRIKSPTYAVVEPYRVGGCDVWHFDFYRFDDPQEWEDAGFRDIFASPGLKLAEWPQKVAALLPPADLQLDLALAGGDARTASVQALTPIGRQLLEGLA